MMKVDSFTVSPTAYARHRSPGGQAALAAFNRINALAAIEAARHGWVGACYSAAELLTALYFAAGERNIVLSKGHAAAMQYACLFGLEQIDRLTLLAYKDGPAAPQAHPDRVTPGILMNTGSLGQALSKTAALAWQRPAERFAVLVGDGELQEGQNYEALMTVRKLALRNLTLVVDENGFQSKRRVVEVKALPELERLFGAFGFTVVSIDGHSPRAVADAWREAADLPTVIIARTTKGGGSRFLAPLGGEQPWHGKVPDPAVYREILAEQAALSGDAQVQEDVATYLRTAGTMVRPSTPTRSGQSTRDAFAEALEEALPRHEELVVLDADLAEACGLSRLVDHPQFLELGIAEQDMVSFAGGLALAGKLPVVNTYASFFKRAYEQLYVNATEGSKLIYAGHYAGLCYFTDGKTHQSLTDLKLMQAIPGLVVLEPVTPAQTRAMFEWAIGPQPQPVYLRLRRTPLPLGLSESTWRPDRPLVVRPGAKKWLLAAGTVATRLALDCLEEPSFADFGLAVQTSFNHPVDRDFWAELLGAPELIVTLEEDLAPGTLFAWTSLLLGELNLTARLLEVAPRGFGASFRSLEACCSHFGFTVDGVRRRVLESG